MTKFVKSQKSGEYVLIKEGDMDFNTRFALTLKDMKEEKRTIDRALTTYIKDSLTGGAEVSTANYLEILKTKFIKNEEN